MNPLMMSAKLKHLTSNFRRNGLKAKDLQEINVKYLHQYNGLKKNEIVAKFLKQFSSYLQRDLDDLGYWHNPYEPNKHLTNLAKVGTFSVFVFHGVIPEKYQNMLLPHITKKLIKVFNLKSMKGFRIQYVKIKKCTYMTSIRLTWRNPDEEARDQIEMGKNGGSEKIIEKIIVERGDREFERGDIEVVKEIRKDFKKSLRELRKDLEKTLIENNYGGGIAPIYFPNKTRRRSHRHHNSNYSSNHRSHRGSRHRHQQHYVDMENLKDEVLMNDDDSISSELSEFHEDDGIVKLFF